MRLAYRRLAKRFHPDTNPEDPNSEELFKKVADAYRVLSNPATRFKYDRSVGVKSPVTPSPDRTTVADNTTQRDITVRLHLTLEQIYQGGHREIKIPRKLPCGDCSGSGNDVSKVSSCPNCDGSGIVRKNVGVDITYPAGVRPGSKLKFSAFGHRLPPENSSGDLLVEITLKPNKYLDVQGDDLHYRMMIGLDLFIEGGVVSVPTPLGLTPVEIPPRMSDGRILKVAGKGLPAFQNKPAGDLFIHIDLCVPKRLSRKERSILNELMALPGFHPPVDADGFTPK